jgi:short-subunit dehydrogenase
MVVALSSVAGFAPLVGRSGYAASKHALHGFLGSLREELHGTGAGVLLACPAFVDTGIDAAALAGDGSAARPGKPVVGRRARPEEVAEAIFGAVAARRRLLLFPGVSRSSYWLWRLWPGLYLRVMRSRLGSEFEGDQGGSRPA